VEDTPLIKVSSQKNYNLCIKIPIHDAPSSKNDKAPLRKINPPPAPPKPNDPTQGKTSGKTNKASPTNTNKPSTSSSAGNNTKLNMVPNNDNTCELKSSQMVSNPNVLTLEYNVIEDMNKMISNFSMFHIYSLTQHHE
jgi:hypothetical protein